MKIFISYASEKRDLAEAIAIELRAQGNQVFLDKDDLPAGLAYDEQIRLAILKSDLMIFLISPESVEAGRYTLTELSVVRKKWPTPQGKVLPVIVEPTNDEDIPAYLKSVTYLEPIGDLVSDVVHAVDLMHTRWGRVRLAKFGAIFLLVLLLVLTGSYFIGKTSKQTVKITREDYLLDAEFTLLGNQPYAHWGDTAELSLQMNSGNLEDYECRIEKRKHSNINKITHDRKCEKIEIEMINSPFVDENGQAINNSSLANLYGAENFKVSVISGRQVVWSGTGIVTPKVVMHPYDFSFTGIPSEKAWGLMVSLGKNYRAALEYKDKQLSDEFVCGFIEPPVDPGSNRPMIDIQFGKDSCTATIIPSWFYKAPRGGVTIYKKPADIPGYIGPMNASFTVRLTHPGTGFERLLRMNAKIDSGME